MGRKTYRFEEAMNKILRGEMEVMVQYQVNGTPTIIYREDILHGEWFVK